MTIKLKNFTFGMIVITSLAFLSAGCGGDHGDMMSSGGDPDRLVTKVYPADGAVGIPTNSAIAIKFAGPMDTMSVMNNLRISFGQDMHDRMDPATHSGGMGHMSMEHMDHLMEWMDSVNMSGEFHWNEAMDSCEFVPESGMMANREHMILMYEGDMIGHGGGMMGGNHSSIEYSEYHFTTGQ